MASATIDEEIIEKVFLLLKEGFKSIGALEDLINERKKIVKNFFKMCRKPGAIAVIERDVINSINLSKKQIRDVFSDMQNKLDVEATQWAALKHTVEEKGSDEAVKGWLVALSKTLEDELGLLPKTKSMSDVAKWLAERGLLEK